LAITKLDVLDGLPEVKICVGYEKDGQPIESIPADAAALEACKPVYETLPGWTESTYGLTDIKQLPAAARKLLDRIAEVCECPVTMLSTGPDRAHICRL
ncbi:MAG TPA: adenylosuccinate synthetase, partial [Mariprofundaceae bacterium]|nr:adenylosuccinate synthetase [Mariprofundaceae bacterium]